MPVVSNRFMHDVHCSGQILGSHFEPFKGEVPGPNGPPTLVDFFSVCLCHILDLAS